MRRLGFQRPINWVFNPVAGALAGRLGEDRIIYYCVDEYTEFAGVDKSGLAAIERDLLSKADLTIVSAQRLFDSKSPLTRRTVLVRHGVDFEHFRKSLAPETTIPAEIAALPRPIIGFFGLIADWVDVELMAKIARRHSTGTLVLLGKATTDISALTALANVRWLGRREYSELPAFCKGFDVALNPFRLNELTLNANPLKVREYLAAGLPVVSTDLPEVAVLRHCRTATTHDEFLAAVDAALAKPGPQEEISDSVRHEGWSARLDEIAGHCAAASGERR
jgi:glycosyltransferase involved in cell wall biosynthesis